MYVYNHIYILIYIYMAMANCIYIYMYKYPMLFHDVPLYAMIELYFFWDESAFASKAAFQ